MRYLLALYYLLVFGLVAQANPATFYRALKHLGFDNKRIAKIVVKVKEQAKNAEVFSLVTQKINNDSHGYRFYQKKSGELVMQKFEVRSGVPILGQQEIIDPNLADYQLALDELVGLTGKRASEAEQFLRTGQPLDIKLSQDQLANHAGIILRVDNGKLVQQHYLIVDGVEEFGERELVDFAMLRQRQVQQEIRAQQRVHQVLQGVIDDINNRKIIDLIEGKAKGITQLPPVKNTISTETIKTIVDDRFFIDNLKDITSNLPERFATKISKLFGKNNIKELMLYLQNHANAAERQLPIFPNKHQLAQIETILKENLDNEEVEKFVGTIKKLALARQQRLLQPLFADSTPKKEKAKLLFELLHVQTPDIIKKLSFSSASKDGTKYYAGTRYRDGTIPYGSLDKYGVNRRQAVRELLHDNVTTSYLNSDDAKKIHTIIDELYHTDKPPTILDKAFDIDAPQKFFRARSFSEVVAAKRQGKVYLTNTELADYQTYLYDEIAEIAIERGQEAQAIALIRKHADALEVTICDSGDCSISLIEDYINALEKSLIERANKNYLDEFKPSKNSKKVAVDVPNMIDTRLTETINAVAKGGNSYDEIAEGVTITKHFAKEFADLPTTQQNTIIEIITNTSDGVQQWRETPPQEGILSYLKENVKTYQRLRKPRMGEARDIKLHTLRVDRRITLYFKQEKNGSIVLANLTTNNSLKAYDDGIERAVSSLQNQYR